MLRTEARQIGIVLKQICLNLIPKENITILNLGAGKTVDFVEIQKQYTDIFIFDDLKKLEMVKIVNIDSDMGPGIDLAMDLMQESAYIEIARYQPDIILVCNLLEHVKSPDLVVSYLTKYVKNPHYLLVSGPKRVPYHPDPIDNLFRPNARQLSKLFVKYGYLQNMHQYRYSFNILYGTKGFQSATRDYFWSLLQILKSPKKLQDRNFMGRFSFLIIFISIFQRA